MALERARATKRKPRSSRSETWHLVQDVKKRPDPQLALEKIAAERGYKPGWVNHVMRVYRISAR